MSPLVYNLALLIGIGCVGQGVRLTYGGGPALIAVGALVLALTVLGAAFGVRR